MEWLATKQATKRAATAARYESHLRLHVLPAFGLMPVAAITRHDVQQWINTLTRDNLSASTIGDIFAGGVQGGPEQGDPGAHAHLRLATASSCPAGSGQVVPPARRSRS